METETPAPAEGSRRTQTPHRESGCLPRIPYQSVPARVPKLQSNRTLYGLKRRNAQLAGWVFASRQKKGAHLKTVTRGGVSCPESPRARQPPHRPRGV